MIHSRSTYGRRAAICEKFGWTMEYLAHGISWAYVIRCLVDFPRYEYNRDGNTQKIKLTNENAADFVKMINSR